MKARGNCFGAAWRLFWKHADSYIIIRRSKFCRYIPHFQWAPNIDKLAIVEMKPVGTAAEKLAALKKPPLYWLNALWFHGEIRRGVGEDTR